MTIFKPIDVVRLRDVLKYDENTGEFTWKVGQRAGKIAGCTLSNGYKVVWFEGKNRCAHRLAYAYMYGDFLGIIDHVNGDPSDNRIANLRIATQSQNRMNSRVRADSASQIKGVWFDRNRWRASIGPRGAVRYLGCFGTMEEAQEARRNAEKLVHGEFARAS